MGNYCWYEIIDSMRENRTRYFSEVQYVFLDRDGVVNEKFHPGGYIRRWEQFRFLPGAVEAIARIKRSGRKVIIVTNQRGVATGLCSEPELKVLHQDLQQYLGEHAAGLDALYYCPHDEGLCDCRKPQTGMFMQAFADFPEANPRNSVMVGDSLCDIEAGRRVGMLTVLIAENQPAVTPEQTRAEALATAKAPSLLAFVEQYLS